MNETISDNDKRDALLDAGWIEGSHGWYPLNPIPVDVAYRMVTESGEEE